MQADQPHPFQDTRVHPFDHLVGDLAVRRVRPPYQDVGSREDLFGQPVFGLVQRRGARRDSFLCIQVSWAMIR